MPCCLFFQCEGRNLAIAELKAFLVHVLQAFEFSITEETLVKTQSEKPLEGLTTVEGRTMLAPKPVPGRRKPILLVKSELATSQTD